MRVELTRPYGHYPLKVACLPIPPPGLIKSPLRAKNGARTRDPDLGKVVLYQLSYFRILFGFNVRYNSSFLELRCKGTIFFSPMQIFNRYF